MPKMNAFLFIFLVNPVLGGHYLFYLPFSSKSVKIGFMPMAKELIKRGHTVTMVCPNPEKRVIPGLTELIHDSGFDSLTQKISDTMLQGSEC